VIEPPPSAAPPNHDTRDDGPPTKRASKIAAADSGADLSEQLRLIDAARAAVAARNATGASNALNSYRTRFPRGPFAQEAAVLQIETLDLQGNHVQAAAQARSFLARYPNSPHVSVVRRIAER
jgi:outer membrane protein assembly factor BamD (BamD/ComL family)